MATTPDRRPDPALATFGFLAGPRIGEELPVPRPVVSIGKGSQNDVVFPDDSVSTTHARLEYEAGHWRLTDLDSTNGTFVEGVRLAPKVPTPLAYGHSVRFGGVPAAVPRRERGRPRLGEGQLHAPAPRRRRWPRRPAGFRLPVWAFALILLVAGARRLLRAPAGPSSSRRRSPRPRPLAPGPVRPLPGRALNITWHAAGGTDVGRMRSGNEDALRLDAGHGIFLVADGMGGHAAGEVASELVAGTVARTSCRRRGRRASRAASSLEALRQAVLTAHDRIADCCEERPETRAWEPPSPHA